MATRRKATTKKKATAQKQSPTPKSGADAIAAMIRSKRGADSVIFRGHGRGSQVTEFIPTGVFPIDWYLCARGGLPVGRLVELYAAEGGGKTSLALQTLGNVQRMGGLAMYIDGEQSLDEERCRLFGVDFDSLLVTEPWTLEEALDDLRVALDSLDGKTGPNLVVMDSIAAFGTTRTVSGEEPKVGEVAGILTKKLKPMLKLMTKKRVCVVAINQMREAIGNMFADTYTPGGRFFKHACTLRIGIYGGKKTDAKHSGKDLTFTIPKSRLGSPHRKAIIRLNYTSGWDDEWSTIRLAKDLDLMSKSAQFNSKNYALAKAVLEDAMVG